MLVLAGLQPLLTLCLCCPQLRYCWDSKLMRGLMSSVTETPEIVLARENAKRISDVCSYAHHLCHVTEASVLGLAEAASC